MEKMSALLLAAAVLLTGCGSNQVSQSASGSQSPETSAAAGTTPKIRRDVVLTMAYASEPSEDTKKLIDRFNAEDNGVTVEIKSFFNACDENGMPIGMTDEDQEQIDFQVTQELINKDTIDLVGPFSFGNGAKFEIFKRKGGFVDLYKFMKDDPDINPDTLNSHILKLCERDGKLYSFPTHYYAKTMIGKSEYVGTKQNWTIDEFIESWNKMPEGSTVNGSLKAEGIYYDVLRQDTPYFIDYENCEVHFDSPDFRKMLEFCHSFDSNMGQKSDGDYNYRSEKLVNNMYLNSYSCGIVTDMDFNSYEGSQYRLRDGSRTLVGYPTSDRNGAYLCGIGECAIRSNISEEKQQAAWEFLREFYTEDYQTENYAKRDEYRDPSTGDTIVQYSFAEGFPINNAARKKIAENMINGEYADSTRTNTANGHEITQLNELTLEQADVDFIDSYISSIDRWEFPNADRALFWIVEEEVLTYLHGEQDIDTTVDHIQDRASIWISEQS